SVEKVYFLINAEDNHWVLAEFHIRSGVITFYDSLPLENLIVEERKWWLDTRQLYADKLLKLLIQSETSFGSTRLLNEDVDLALWNVC
ncbi:ulp1 protease family, C-terminal catalytic domain-containing protein, partial [Tanacetum coccineum]